MYHSMVSCNSLAPGRITDSPDKALSKERTKDSIRGSARSMYGHIDGRSNHARTKLHRTNHACKSTDDGRGRSSIKHPPP